MSRTRLAQLQTLAGFPDLPALQLRRGGPGLAHATMLALALSLTACTREANVAKLPEAPAARPAAPQQAMAKPQSISGQPSTDPTAAKAEAATGQGASDTLPPPPPGSTALSGQTEAHRRSTLTPRQSSIITRVSVRDGDFVKTGQVLVTLDTQDFALRLQQAESGLQAAKVQRDSAKLDWNRTKALLDDKAVPQAQFDMVDARLKGAQAGVAQAETAVAMGRKALRDAIIRAPFNGVIVKRLANEGEYATVMPATPLVVIEEFDPLDLRVQVPSTEIDKVKIGDTIHARFPATGQTLDAKLTRVVSALDPRTRTFSAIAELPNHDHALRSGLYAEVVMAAGKPAPSQAGSGKTAGKAKMSAKKPAAKVTAKAVSKD
jgi:RND family efflux transporter MFP subunit